MLLLADNALWFDDRSLKIALAAGAIVLSLAVLVLMVTRWGRVRLVSKCALLSLYAHLLLLGYAHVTPIIWQTPGQARAELAIRVLDDAEVEKFSEPEPTKPWHAPTEIERVEPDAKSLARIEANVSPLDRAEQTTDPTAGATAPVDHLPPDGVRIDSGSALRQRPSPVRGAGAAALAEVPQAQRQDPAAVAPPATAELTRSPLAENLVAAPPRMATGVPAELTDATARLQRLNDVASPNEAASAIAARLDQPDAARNQSASERERGGVPQTAVNRVASSSGVVPLPAGPAFRPGDGAPLPGIYAQRAARQQSGAVQRTGSHAEADTAVAAALAWLAANQEKNGSWNAQRHGAGRELRVDQQDRKGAGADADPAMTALAVLAFQADGQSHLTGAHRQHVQHGLEFLIRNIKPDGNLAGAANNTYTMMYCHGMATLAVAEAYALTGDARLKPAVERAVTYSVASQHSTTGGWRYQPGDQGDMSQFGWQVMALTSAEIGGIAVPDRTKAGMRLFLRSCSSGAAGGLACYRPGDRATRPMTAEALACRYFLQNGDSPSTLAEAARYITDESPAEGPVNLYAWYYASLALHQYGGPEAARWHEALQKRLLALQEKAGDQAGSWAPTCIWGGYGGRVYTTAVAALCLQAPHRFASPK